MFKATLFTIVKTWKYPKCLPGRRMDQMMWYINIMEYYSAIKKNKPTPSAATCNQLEIIVLSEVSQKDKYHMISFKRGM